LHTGAPAVPKQKTNKSAKKRIRVTASGKIKHNKCGKRHLASGKTGSRKRKLRQPSIKGGIVAKKYIAAVLGG
jgi:large subunit ribosomal protein L35